MTKKARIRPSSKTAEVIRKKLRRIRRSGDPRVLDVFSGCGGMTLGFRQAGCVSVGGIEQDPVAARSYALNFHEELEEYARSRDVRTCSAVQLSRELGWGPKGGGSTVDFIIAGPPCPSFSRIGRAKLASLNGNSVTGLPDKEAYLKDQRTHLYEEVIRLAAELKPLALVMENVPEFLQHGGTNHGDRVCDQLKDLGYRCRYSVLNAASYGVPQWRDRFILVAIHEVADVDPEMPVPTHSMEGRPVGYKGRLTHLQLDLGWWSYSVPPPAGGTKKPVTAGEALHDLPRIEFNVHMGRKGDVVQIRPGWSQAEGFRYRSNQTSTYAASMQAGLDLPDHMHVTRRLSMGTGRDQRIFKEMRMGAEYREALNCGRKALERHRGQLRVKKKEPLKGSREDKEMIRQYLPPYPEDKFNNKWWKLQEDQPSRTLTAHMGKDTYSHIHYDGTQARTITVREAARLQSIPDDFLLAGRMNDRFRQIGNSVPPLMAQAIARTLLQTVRRPTR